MEHLDYLVCIDVLPQSEGGGYVATVPDLPGCMSDGETPTEALHNVEGAIEEWLATARSLDRPVPAPTRRLNYA